VFFFSGDSNILGCQAVWFGKELPAFRVMELPSFLGYSNLEQLILCRRRHYDQ